MKSKAGKNTGHGMILSLNGKKHHPPAGVNLPDPFFDSFAEETLTCYDILNEAGLQGQNTVTITFERAFLKKLVRSHLDYIKHHAD